MSLMDFEFEGPVVEWRGPAPVFFLRVPARSSAGIEVDQVLPVALGLGRP